MCRIILNCAGNLNLNVNNDKHKDNFELCKKGNIKLNCGEKLH